MAEPGRPDPSTHEARRVDRLAFTLDADTGEILKYEAVDAAGARRELSENERVELAKTRRGEAVEDLIERGFEAGACLPSRGRGRAGRRKRDGRRRQPPPSAAASPDREEPCCSGPATGRASTRNRAVTNQRRPRFPRARDRVGENPEEGRKGSKGSTSDK